MTPVRANTAAVAVAAAVLLSSPPASAHLVSTRFGEYYAGLLHPLTTLVHLVPWIALALLAAVQGKADARRNLLAFPAAVALGVVLGAWLPGLAAAQAFNIASLSLLGALVALAVPLPSGAFLALSLLCGLSHGYANAAGALEPWSLTLYTAGVATAAYLLSALLGAAGVAASRLDWGLVAVRALGSWILASGLLYAGFNLVGSSGA
jgi:hydrogenase/urease accessory protein HupE